MNMFSLSCKYLKSNISATFLHILTFAAGISILLLVVNISGQLENHFKQGSNIDAVVGAKGSPLQLVLSSVYHVDIPSGNIDYGEAKRLTHDRNIKNAVPISLGDNVGGYRIVGTTPDFLDLYQAPLREGTLWKNSMEAVMGSQVAKNRQLSLGDQFAGSHGLVQGGDQHDHSLYTVSGILEQTGTIIDRLVVTSLDSVWDIHDHHDHEEEEHHEEHDDDERNHHGHEYDEEGHQERNHDHETHGANIHEDGKKEVTALLIQYRNRAAALSFPRMVNKNTNMQAASPSFEIARLFQTVGVELETVKMIGGVLLLIAIIGIFMVLLSNIRKRRYDLAILRVHGTKPASIIALVVYEGLLLTLLSLAAGLVASRMVLCIVNYAASHTIDITFDIGLITFGELVLMAVLIIVSIIASIIPALMAYRINIVNLLLKKS